MSDTVKRIQEARLRSVFEDKISRLLPKRQEIIYTIRQHRQVSFDFLARNFRGIRPRTLHYDLAQLIKGGFIKKLGTTRGALYIPVDII